MKKQLFAIAIIATMLAATISFSIPAVACPVDDDDDSNDVVLEYGSLVLGKDLGKKVSYTGSMTGGYPNEAVPEKNGKYDHSKYPHDLATAIKENGNSWFQYNGAMNFDEQDSYTFAIVQGDKLNVTGEFTITHNSGTNFTVTIGNDMDVINASFSISNTMHAFKNKSDKGFDPAYIWTTAPGQQQFTKFNSGNTYSFDATWVEDLSEVYFYMHLEGLTGYVDTFGAAKGTTFDVKVTGPSYPAGEIFKVPMNGSIRIDRLITGEYVIKEVESGWKATYYVNGGPAVTTRSVTVTILKDAVTTVKLKNEPGEDEELGYITFQKMVETADGSYTPGEGFEFKAYANNTRSGDPIATATSGENGIVTFDASVDFVVGETYYVFETTGNPLYKFGLQGEFLALVAVEENTAAPIAYEVFKNDLVTGKLVLSKEVVKKVCYTGSMTGGYPGEAVPDALGKYDHSKYPHDLATTIQENGKNWFQYNGAMNFDEQDSYTFAIVQGNKLNVMGEFTITHNSGTNFTVTIGNDMDVINASFSISNNMQAFNNKNDAGFDPTYIWTTAPGQQQFTKFNSGNTYSFDATWVDDLSEVYFYMHLEGLTGYVDNYGIPEGTTFEVLVTGPSYPEGKSFQVPMNGSITIDGLIPGDYIVKEVESGWIATYYVNGGPAITAESVTVTIEKDTVTTVKLKNEPVVEDELGYITFQKMVEVAKGEYEPGAGFEFEAYADSARSSDPIATATSGGNGIVKFAASVDFVVGETYYVFETTENLLYRVGNLEGYLALVAVEENTAAPIAYEVFKNDIDFGALDVTADVQKQWSKVFYKPQYEESGSDQTVVSWVGYGKNAATEMPDSFTGYFFDNGFTYWRINAAELEASGEVGVDIGIALSNMSGGSTINDSWNTPLGHTYNVKIVGNELVVSIDLIEGNFGVMLSDKAWSAAPMSDLKHNSVSTYSLSGNVNSDGYFYLFFHMEAGSKWYNQSKIIGWNEHHTKGPFTKAFAGDVTMTVTDSAGTEVYSGALGLVNDLMSGEYSVLVFADDKEIGNALAIVELGKTTSLNFGVLKLPLVTKNIYIYP